MSFSSKLYRFVSPLLWQIYGKARSNHAQNWSTSMDSPIVMAFPIGLIEQLPSFEVLVHPARLDRFKTRAVIVHDATHVGFIMFLTILTWSA